jgi:2-polyprenyl-3-methyl-5-hydroxy-6-metoxy-1,4-benzoquinol methylase
MSTTVPRPYATPDSAPAHAYLWPAVLTIIKEREISLQGTKLFDLGCGNGVTANMLSSKGLLVCGVDPSTSGIAEARKAYPGVSVSVGDSEDDLAGIYGQFPLVLSLEVVEHCVRPRRFAACVFDLLEPSGTAIISTPYHGYLKNLALAVSNKMDFHFMALLDGGHIKFWSERTLRALLLEAGFENISFKRVGRVPPLAKSMIAIATKPQ